LLLRSAQVGPGAADLADQSGGGVAGMLDVGLAVVGGFVAGAEQSYR
jgi:hypothetical protein